MPRDSCMANDLPVLVVAFKRHQELRQCLRHLKDAGVRRVFVSVDAPRDEQEIVDSKRLKEVLLEFSGMLELTSRFAESNQGCRRWVASSISWFFEQVEFGVIVEEDVLVDKRFFDWCMEMRARFDGSGDVMHLNAFVPQCDASALRQSRRTKYVTSWGWATWRGAWVQYDAEMGDLFEHSFLSRVRYLKVKIGCGWRVALHYALALQMARQEKLSSWAYRWALTIWRNDGVAISPGINLSRNIGVGIGATHTSHEDLDRYLVAAPRIPVSLDVAALDAEGDRRYFSAIAGSKSITKTLRMGVSVLVPNGVFFWLRRKFRT